MLDLGDEPALNVPEWSAVASRAELPATLRGEATRYASDGVMADCQRRYIRKFCFKSAVARVGDDFHACYAKDLSRMGLGFFSPVNLLPKKVIRLWLSNGQLLKLRVVRCRRLGDKCYEIGTVFHIEPLNRPRR